MIECRNISISYKKKTIVHNASLKAESGKITVILGKNGCGKTTLFRGITGNIPYSGSICVDKMEIKALSSLKRGQLISLMPQMLRLPHISVREFVSFGRQPYTGITGILSKKDCEIIENVINKTGLAHLSEARLDCISGGERQKAYFALLLAQQTPNILLDEPVSHLDESYANELMDFLRQEKENGKTILTVFHNINHAIKIADKVIAISKGEIAFDGGCDDFCQSDIPEKMFGLKKYACIAPGEPQKYCFL